jgi:integrase/recombinase XerD
MTNLHAAMRDYLAIRRRLGFTLARHGVLLPDFVAYLSAADAEHVTTELALAWARLPAGASPAWSGERLGIVRGFARHLKSLDPATEIPPHGLLRSGRRRVTPYLYSEADIAALMAAASELRPPWRAVTYQTLIGLLSITGLRLGEALGLDLADVDLADGRLLVRRAKLGNQRVVFLHPTTIDVLRSYLSVRAQQWPLPTMPALFISVRGARLGAGTVHDNFPALVRAAGLQALGPRRPRPHDLRHSFAVTSLLGWYRDGADVQGSLPALSTWLGHVHPADTYWYLQAAPELLALAAQRLEIRGSR